jgi:Zn-dependent protease with chaperone function
MYTNFIYFIVVLLIFSTQQPSLTPHLNVSLTLSASIALLFLFAIINRQVFKKLLVKISGLSAGPQLAVLYHRTVSRQSLLALLFFCLQIYLLDVKSHLVSVALIRVSFTLQGLIALGLFLLHLAIVWFYSHECYCGISHTSCSQSSIVVGNLKFNLAILLPWFLISGVVDLLQLAPGGLLTERLSSPLGMVIFYALLLILFILFAPLLVVRLWNCHPLPPGASRSLIEKFCQEQDFQVREVVLLPGSGGLSLTAGVMGILRYCRYLLVTEGLLNILDDDELSSVLAHEMGHVKERHLLFYLLFLLGYLVLAAPLSTLLDPLVFASISPKLMLFFPESARLTFLSLLYALPLLCLLVLYFRFLFGFFIRNFERQADLYVFSVMPRPYPLISALEKVALHSGDIRDVPSWHHFSIKQRVDYLVAAANRPSLIRRHRLKLRKSLAAYLVGLALVGTMGYLYQVGVFGQNLNEYLRLRALTNLVQLEPENGLWRFDLGTLHYQRDNLKEAVKELKVALELEPRNPEIMNNLAWILATSQKPPFFQPEQALALAEGAAQLSSRPHILDTLAEAYYANGRATQALAAAEQALATASGDRSYYIKQAKKFRRLAEEQGSEI